MWSSNVFNDVCSSFNVASASLRDPEMSVSAREHAQFSKCRSETHHIEEITRTLCYIYRNCFNLWTEMSGWKGSITDGLGADLSLPQCLSVTTGIWSLTHKSDHRAEISGNIVGYDALAPRPEVLLSWCFLRACAVSLELNFLPNFWEKGSA